MVATDLFHNAERPKFVDMHYRMLTLCSGLSNYLRFGVPYLLTIPHFTDIFAKIHLLTGGSRYGCWDFAIGS